MEMMPNTKRQRSAGCFCKTASIASLRLMWMENDSVAISPRLTVRLTSSDRLFRLPASRSALIQIANLRGSFGFHNANSFFLPYFISSIHLPISLSAFHAICLPSLPATPSSAPSFPPVATQHSCVPGKPSGALY